GNLNGKGGCSVQKEEVENDNEEVTLLKLELFFIKALQQGHTLIEGAEEDLLMRIQKNKNIDKAVVKVVEELKHSPT
ncbi:hypothetical protein DXG01_003829, partial [Tephrocybe rancida]